MLHGTPPSLRLVMLHAHSLGLCFSFPFQHPMKEGDATPSQGFLNISCTNQSLLNCRVPSPTQRGSLEFLFLTCGSSACRKHMDHTSRTPGIWRKSKGLARVPILTLLRYRYSVRGLSNLSTSASSSVTQVTCTLPSWMASAMRSLALQPVELRCLFRAGHV